MTDKVISHAASLLTTYASFTAAAQAQAPQRQEGSARSEMEAA